jgi:hypothetical protein
MQGNSGIAWTYVSRLQVTGIANNGLYMHQERLTTEETAVVVIPMQLLSAVDSASDELPASVEVVITRTQFEQVIKPVTDLVYCVVKDCIDQWHSIRYAIFPRRKNYRHCSRSFIYPVPCIVVARNEKLGLTSSDSSLPQLDELILVGGCSCIPGVKKALRRACRDSGVAKFVQKKAVTSPMSDVENNPTADIGTAIKV